MNERNLLIGTAGHVDHGKSKLIEALTGIETDRLREEKERGISIELGFAFLNLPNGKKAGIVDVPGHEKFVRQMLAGASGMDVVLLVVAADEGVMPQTIEHLNILEILQIDKGIVVLTKVDLVDKEWLHMIEQDTKEKLKGSFLEGALYSKVSSTTREGIPELQQNIVSLLDRAESRRSNTPARMPIDRVFTISGFGTVVTGTLSTGTFHKGQEVIIEPATLLGKVRNIQVHGDQLSEVCAGQRAAINISGLSVGDIERGSSLVVPGYFKTGQIIDVEIKNLPSEKRSIKQRQRIHFHIGTAEVLGRIHLLEQEEVAPGETALGQVILEGPVLAAAGDRFVLRYYSPVTTIGGGKVLGLATIKRKRYKDKVLEELRMKASGNDRDLLIKVLQYPQTTKDLISKTGLLEEDITNTLCNLKREEVIVSISKEENCLFWLKDAAQEWIKSLSNQAVDFQKHNPLRIGIGKEELRRRLAMDISLKSWQTILEWGSNSGYFNIKGNNVILNLEFKLPEKIQKQVDHLISKWEAAGLNPPTLIEGARACGIIEEKVQEFAAYLTELGKWVHINGYYFSFQSIGTAKNRLIALLTEKEKISPSEARDLWQTSRKYAIPLLEYFDSIHITKRDGDIRVLDETQKKK